MKRFGLFLAVILAVTTAPLAWGNGPWQVFFQNIRLPFGSVSGQAVLEHYKVAAPGLGSSTTLISTTSLVAGKTQTTFTNQPDFARNITIAFTGTTGSIASGNIVVSGTNVFSKAITETISITDGTTKTGSTAFKTLTSIVFPATTGADGDVTYTVKEGAKLGINRCATNAGDLAWTELGGAYEATRGTFAVDATHVELNTITTNGALDGSKNVDVFYVQNFACYGN